MLYDTLRTSNFSAEFFEPEYWRRHDAIEGTARGRGTTWFIRSRRQQLRAAPLPARRPDGKNFKGRVICGSGESETRSFAEWYLTYHLHRAGLPVPAPIAARYRRTGMFYRADLITQRIENSESLAARLLEGAAVAHAVDRRRPLHPALPRRRRVSRRSQRAQHPADARAGLPHRLRSRQLRKRGWWADTTLVRLYRSLEKVTLLAAPESFTDEDWHSLLAGYRESAGLPQASLDLKLRDALRLHLHRLSDLAAVDRRAGAARLPRSQPLAGFLAALRARARRCAAGAASGCTRCRWARCRPSVPLVEALLEALPDSSAGADHGHRHRARARAQAMFGARVDVRYVPIDLPGSVRRFFQRVKPRLAVILETEIWPNLYHRCGRLGVPLVLASARISPRSVNSYRRLVGLFRETLSHGIFIAAQSERGRGAIPSPSARVPSARTWSATSSSISAMPPDIEAQRRTNCGACWACTGRCGWRAARTRRKKTC